MSKPKLADYFRGGLLRLRQAASDELHAMPAYRSLTFSGAAPLLQKPWPERPQTPDPQLGNDIAKGIFQLAGKQVGFTDIDQLWASTYPTREFARSLHEFSWMTDLLSIQDKDQARTLARKHADAWIRNFGNWNRFAWSKEITAERCLAWLSASKVLFSGDAVAASTRLDALARQLRHLKSIVHVCQPGETRLWIAIALATAGTCFYEMKSWQKSGLTLLERELSLQILPDGGHISRNPQIAARLLFELNNLEALLKGYEQVRPVFLQQTKDRLLPFVRFATMPNTELAPFNGGGIGDKALLQQQVQTLDPAQKPFLIAPHSGYHRLQGADSALILDCGGEIPALYSRNAHAGSLGFVFTTKSGTLVTNCGWSDTLDSKWRGPSRTSAAHSTLIIDDVSSSHISTNKLATTILGPVVYNREPPVRVRRTEEEAGVWLTASHLEYATRYGLQHTRRLFLLRSGTDLRGEDTLERPIGFSKTKDLRPIPFAIRFHLHPKVRASASRDGASVLLLFPNGEGWRFICDCSPISLEPSVYLASGSPPKRSQQIHIAGAAAPNGTGEEPSNKIRWSFRKIESKH